MPNNEIASNSTRHSFVISKAESEGYPLTLNIELDLWLKGNSQQFQLNKVNLPVYENINTIFVVIKI